MKPLIIANWKMNPQSLAKARYLLSAIKKEIRDIKSAEIVICPPFVYLSNLEISKYQNIALGSQNCFWEQKGAFTGEISAAMLKNLGCQYVIVGHSERRRLFHETNETINKKIKAALKAKLKPILCVGEISQINRCIKGISKKDIKKIIFAYEPIFAIGTGKPCDIKKAKKINFLVRKILNKDIKILYGGSVNSKNAGQYIKEAGFDGLLVGGASLKPIEFIKIVKGVGI